MDAVTTRNSSPTALVLFLQFHHGVFWAILLQDILNITLAILPVSFLAFLSHSDSLIWPARVPLSHTPHHAALFKRSEASNLPVRGFYTGKGPFGCKGIAFSVFGFVLVQVCVLQTKFDVT